MGAVGQVSLNDRPTHGMTDEDRFVVQGADPVGDVVDVIGESEPVQLMSSRTPAVSAQAQGDRVVATFGEEGDITIPAPSAMTHAVHQNERHINVFRTPADHFEILPRVSPDLGSRGQLAVGHVKVPSPRR
jgi:hypothetical protein